MIGLVLLRHLEGDRMISIRDVLGPVLSALIAVASGEGGRRGAAAQVGADPAVTPWEREDSCRWWIGADDGGHRGSISPGDFGMVLTISDPVFADWSNSGEHAIELAFDGDPRASVKGQAWVSHIVDRPSSMLSVELDAAGLGKLAGAKRLMISRDSMSTFAMDLAGTPGRTELEACIPLPGRGHGDAES